MYSFELPYSCICYSMPQLESEYSKGFSINMRCLRLLIDVFHADGNCQVMIAGKLVPK